MLKVFSFLKRKPGMSRDEFRDYYENHHVPLVCRLMSSPPVYKRNYLETDGPLAGYAGASIQFDVVTEQVFPDRAAFEAWVAQASTPDTGPLIRADEDRFLDRSHYHVYSVDEHVTSALPIDAK